MKRKNAILRRNDKFYLNVISKYCLNYSYKLVYECLGNCVNYFV